MILVTGAAGFIGFHTARALLARGETVIGIDNLNDYYDVGLKEKRLAILEKEKPFTFYKVDIADRVAVNEIFAKHKITQVVHFAAQAGVRHSLSHPFEYCESNVHGLLVMLEAARHCDTMAHFVYASSSSVYGGNDKQPFSVDDAIDKPISLYAATKRAGELMVQSYSHLYGLPATGLRFFTVYGPWGRPDMAYFSFTRDIIEGNAITIFNNGDMKRDFTWIDDCVGGVLGALDHPPVAHAKYCIGDAPHRIFNIGNNRAEKLLDFVGMIEKSLGKTTEKIMAPPAPGDVAETWADISPAQEIFGYNPETSLQEGLPRFVQWYCDYKDISLAA